MAAATRRIDLMKAGEIQVQCSEFLRLMNNALAVGGLDFQSSAWDKVRDILGNISRSRAQQGFSPSETATFVFSVKRPLFSQLRRSYKDDPQALAAETWSATELLDEMGLFTLEFYQKSREDIIKHQQEELLELSTPVVKLWDGVLALPIIGTLDSARTQVVMESSPACWSTSDSPHGVVVVKDFRGASTLGGAHAVFWKLTFFTLALGCIPGTTAVRFRAVSGSASELRTTLRTRYVPGFAVITIKC